MGAGGQAQTPGMMNRPDMPAQAAPQMQHAAPQMQGTPQEMMQHRFGQLPQQAQNNMNAWWGQQSPVAPGQAWWMQQQPAPWQTQQRMQQMPWAGTMPTLPQAPQLPQQAQVPQLQFTNTMGLPPTPGVQFQGGLTNPMLQKWRGY